MSEDLVSLKILLVSEAAAERETIRRAASQVSVPIEVVEIEATEDETPVRERLAKEDFDAIFFDSRMSRQSRQALIDAARAAKSHPLAILVGAAEMKTRVVLTDGLAVDGALAKPIDLGEARTLLDGCVRARLSRRALIVDDSATVRSVVRKVLDASRFRFEAEEAEQGQAAIEKASSQHFDIVFLDVNMPVLDGFATLAELQRSHPDTDVVMITSSNDPKLADRAKQAGAKAVLFKPFYVKDVDKLTSQLLGLVRSA